MTKKYLSRRGGREGGGREVQGGGGGGEGKRMGVVGSVSKYGWCEAVERGGLGGVWRVYSERFRDYSYFFCDFKSNLLVYSLSSGGSSNCPSSSSSSSSTSAFSFFPSSSSSPSTLSSNNLSPSPPPSSCPPLFFSSVRRSANLEIYSPFATFEVCFIRKNIFFIHFFSFWIFKLFYFILYIYISRIMKRDVNIIFYN